MFHVKHRRPFVALLALFALVATGCAAIQNPEGWAPPVEVDGQILVQSSSGQVSLVDPANGQVAWRYPNDGGRDRALYAQPLVDGDAVYLADYSGRVTRLDIGSGTPEVRWTAEAGSHVVATPALDNGTLHVPTANGRIVLVNTGDGRIVETYRPTERRIWGSPAIRGDMLYFGDLDHGETVAMNLTSGEIAWEQSLAGATAAEFVLDAELLLVGSFDQQLHALEVEDGSERWGFRGRGWFLARPVVQDGTVYAASMGGGVYAIDRTTGAERWSFLPEGAEFRAAPVIMGGNLVAVARDGRVFALDLASGAVAWQQDAVNEGNVNANPLVVGSDIYLVTSRHDLVRVDASRQGAFQTVPLVANR